MRTRGPTNIKKKGKYCIKDIHDIVNIIIILHV